MSEDDKIIDKLLELDIEQIEELRKRHKESNPDNRHYDIMCGLAIAMKHAEQRKENQNKVIEMLKNESAPSSATNTEQGNETR